MNGNNNPNNSNMPNLDVVKGLLAIIFGIVLVVLSFRVVLSVICLVAGGMMVYYGLIILNMKQAVNYINQVMAQIRRIFLR